MEVLKGSGTSGDVVLNNQVLAKKEGFQNVSKIWYNQTMSYEQGLEALEAGRAEREDIVCPASEFVPGRKDDDNLVFVHKPTGREYKAAEHALRQFATWAYIPHTYVNSAMKAVLKPNKEVRFERDTLDAICFAAVLQNGHRHIEQDKKFLFRTYKDGTMRAMLSEDYSIVDNRWYIETLRKILPGGRLSHWKGDADSIYGNVLIEDSIRQDSDGDYGAMISIGNSEIGIRGIDQLPSVFRAICMNGCIWDQLAGVKFHKIHRGIELSELEIAILENVNAQVPLLDDIVQKFLDTRELKLSARVKQVFALIADENSFTGKQIESVASNFLNHEKADKNLFGIINAITRAGQEFDTDTWLGFDKLAGKMAGMSKANWERFNKRASALTDEQVSKALAV